MKKVLLVAAILLLVRIVNAQGFQKAEYFIDTDPGIGHGISIVIASGADTLDFEALVADAALSPGFHLIGLRVLHSTGVWSMTTTRSFYVPVLTPPMAAVAAAEYFFDADPGVGNGVALTVPVPGDSIVPQFSIPVPTSLSQGQHFLVIRVKDQAGNWSLGSMDTLVVTGTLPVHLISFTAAASNNIVTLEWETSEEIDNSHFDIERSRNGIEFIKIGRVHASAGAAVKREYLHIDIAPLQGINYYRLKQTDMDGQFRYSPVRNVWFAREGGAAMNIYPNPATQSIQFSFNSREQNLLISLFDATGRILNTRKVQNAATITLPVQSLSAGRYCLQVSDGIKSATGCFIKQ